MLRCAMPFSQNWTNRGEASAPSTGVGVYRDSDHLQNRGPTLATSTRRSILAVLGGRSDLECDFIRAPTAEGAIGPAYYILGNAGRRLRVRTARLATLMLVIDHQATRSGRRSNDQR